MSNPFVIADFRTQFPEFADTTKYPDPLIQFWADFADSRLNELIWGDQRIYGLKLFTAHQIVLAIVDQEDAEAGSIPGQGTAIVSSESAGGVSIGIDTSASIESEGGHWNETRYGRQYLRMARMLAMGGHQL